MSYPRFATNPLGHSAKMAGLCASLKVTCDKIEERTLLVAVAQAANRSWYGLDTGLAPFMATL